MSLIRTIKTDQLAARRARDTIKIDLLTTLIGEAETVGKAGQREVQDVEVVTMIKKFLKNNAETQAALMNSLNISDASSNSKLVILSIERIILEAYQPIQLTEIMLIEILDRWIASGQVNDIGDAMKLLKTCHSGQYDGGVASKLLKTKFSKV